MTGRRPSEQYDGVGHLLGTSTTTAARGVQVQVPAGGFTIVRR